MRKLHFLLAMTAIATGSGAAQALTLLPYDTGTVMSSTLNGITHDAADAAMSVSTGSFKSLSAQTAAYALFQVAPGLQAQALTLRFTTTVAAAGTSGEALLSDITLPAAAFDVSYLPVPIRPPGGPELMLDLLTGASYGPASNASAGTQSFAVALAPAALAGFNGQAGGMFGVGFHLGSFNSGPLVIAFGMQISEVSLEVTPVPEPASAALLLGGLAALALRRRQASLHR